MAEVGYLVVRQEVLIGSHKLCPAVEGIRMMSLPKYLARNEDACTLAGKVESRKVGK